MFDVHVSSFPVPGFRAILVDRIMEQKQIEELKQERLFRIELIFRL